MSGTWFGSILLHDVYKDQFFFFLQIIFMDYWSKVMFLMIRYDYPMKIKLASLYFVSFTQCSQMLF
jgi:hypothetical protein